MRTTTLLLAAVLVATTLPMMPSAEADTCAMSDPRAEAVVCPVILAGFCAMYAVANKNVKGALSCRPYLP